MIRLETMRAKATMVIKNIEPLLAGNLPRMIQYCVTIVSLIFHLEVWPLSRFDPRIIKTAKPRPHTLH